MERRTFGVGQEWLVDASGCDADLLRDLNTLAALFETLVVTLNLKVIGQPQWHAFPEPGGVTGLALLSESHLAIHTFPEHRYAALSVYSCRENAAPDFGALMRKHLRAESTTGREITRSAVS